MSQPNHGEYTRAERPFYRRAFAALGVCLNAIHLRRPRPPGSKASRLLFLVRRSIICFFAISVALVVCLRWIPPFTSAVMIEDHIERFLSGKKQNAISHQWADLEEISPYMCLAVVAAEDQSFPDHWGFDFESIRKAVEERKRRGRLRGASTITQQTAKNLFLWNGRSYVRKGFEAYFAVLLELLWPKSRILEVYLNIAQFGDGVYGVRAAAETYLHKNPSKLTRRDAALLAAVLPSPLRFKVRHPSSYVSGRRYWILRQMSLLGGVEYLRNL